MLRAFSARNGSTNPRPSELVSLGLAESRQSYVRGVVLSREPPKLQQAQPLLAAWDRYRALLPSFDTRCWRAELGMRHADLLREATAVIATPASAPCMILQSVGVVVLPVSRPFSRKAWVRCVVSGRSILLFIYFTAVNIINHWSYVTFHLNRQCSCKGVTLPRYRSYFGTVGRFARGGCGTRVRWLGAGWRTPA